MLSVRSLAMSAIGRHAVASLIDSSACLGSVRNFTLRPPKKRIPPPATIHPFAPRFYLRRSEREKVDMTRGSEMKVGTVVGVKMKHSAKVRVEFLFLEKRVIKYFRKNETYYCRDLNNRCVLGDTVLICSMRDVDPTEIPRHIVVDLLEPAPQGCNPYNSDLAYSRIARQAHHEFEPWLPIDKEHEAARVAKEAELAAPKPK